MATPHNYSVGWICAIEPEYLAAQLCFDGEPEALLHSPSPNDSNAYSLGTINGHKVVIACLPRGSYGTTSAAIVSANMLRSFPNIKVGLMVGLGGGAPTPDADIRLGDIVVSTPGDGQPGVLQYDYGRTVQGQEFELTGALNRPPTALLTAVTNLNTEFRRKPKALEEAITDILEKLDRELREDLTRPDVGTDVLYQAGFTHPEISDWANDPGSEAIFWLNGKAGTGKSTISRTIAFSFAKAGELGASFFFKRGEGSVGSASHFCSTIASQLASTAPTAAHHIRDAIDSDPEICQRR
ncbi:unnamed protein product [Parascedosporium putredinis]|uniref:Nephrocystin 3-like N-terminal domain-containing protein n=1 Tax=Parascedosporium putredinis TaxID=1442378 RepID=A0A9P1H4B8_9PEZI|nr:unnamed protein product [Parascedosporium putredinis]CAI7996415.1 unnamed protein product [Parascedosporium putredinis]